jgi:hypothetical protein
MVGLAALGPTVEKNIMLAAVGGRGKEVTQDRKQKKSIQGHVPNTYFF